MKEYQPNWVRPISAVLGECLDWEPRSHPSSIGRFFVTRVWPIAAICGAVLFFFIASEVALVIFCVSALALTYIVSNADRWRRRMKRVQELAIFERGIAFGPLPQEQAIWSRINMVHFHSESAYESDKNIEYFLVEITDGPNIRLDLDDHPGFKSLAAKIAARIGKPIVNAK